MNLIAISFIKSSFNSKSDAISSELLPIILNSYCFNYSMNPGFGSAIGLTNLIFYKASFKGVLNLKIKYANVKLVARLFPAKQWISTLLLLINI